jgi:aerobic carbon-monoxide dehydrogenase medium subunit
MRRYHYPETLDAACALMAGGDAMVYGGGTAVQILLKQGAPVAADLVDIAAVPGLTDLTEMPPGLRVGPLVTLRRLETDPLVRAVAPLLADVCGRAANPRVRNTATIGGNLAQGDPRFDPPTALLVLDAAVHLASAAGTRTVPMRQFTMDGSGEIIIAIDVPRQPGGAFVKLSGLAANDRACASAAALVLDRPSGERQVRLGLGALARTPVFVELSVPAGADADAAVDAAWQAAEPRLDPIADVRGGPAYKRRLARVAVDEAVRLCWKDLPWR